jgi:YfiH family protein
MKPVILAKTVITPNWPAPNNVKAYTTTRDGGVSLSPYQSLNIATHVGDNSEAVKENRIILAKKLNLTSEPIWLNQTHSAIALPAIPANINCTADASFTRETAQVCAIMTADCLPILICNTSGTEVAAIHAGWRGLAGNIINNTVQALTSSPEDLLVWLGPAIGPSMFEVGSDMRDCFIKQHPATQNCFIKTDTAWLANIYLLARYYFSLANVTAIYGGDNCTFKNKDQFFSYRRDGQYTGRMASLIWLTVPVRKINR